MTRFQQRVQLHNLSVGNLDGVTGLRDRIGPRLHYKCFMAERARVYAAMVMS